MACKMWFGFQFNLSDSSDDDLRGCLRVRPDANADADADANRSKTICRPPLKGVDIMNEVAPP